MNTKEITIPVLNNELQGALTIPEEADSIVIFSHGSGSSRKSSRNQMVARLLQAHHIGTLLFDLLTEDEDRNYLNRFNIDLLTERLIAVTRWVKTNMGISRLSIGYFGASTGAASALRAAARLPDIKAVVSRGGRPDMALEVLHKVKAPVLLIVGSRDIDVLEMNKKAYSHLTCEKQLKLIEGATHLFEEPGTLDKVAEDAIEWFEKYLVSTNKLTNV